MLMIALAAQVAAPPARVVLPPAPPPVYVPTVIDRETSAARFVVDVEIRGGNAVLWSGPLRIGSGYAQTSVRRDQTEPGDSVCAPGQAVSPVNSSLFLTLSPRGQSGDILVNVRWSRPGEQPCGAGPNARVVELSGTVALTDARAATLTGDGGLVVRLHRR